MKALKYIGLILIAAAWLMEHSRMSPDRIILQVPMVIAGLVIFVERFQRDVVDSTTRALRHDLQTARLSSTPDNDEGN
jgi:hypothetical protein